LYAVFNPCSYFSRERERDIERGGEEKRDGEKFVETIRHSKRESEE
jgi:hypothetical protein